VLADAEKEALVRDIQVRDLLVLARADLATPQEHLKQLYLWRYEYISTAAKAVVGAGASLMVAVVAAAFQHEKGAAWWPILVGALGASVVLGAGVFAYRRIREIYREYVVAQELLAEAIGVQSFLRLYESRTPD
jgi:hypothetical protein